MDEVTRIKRRFYWKLGLAMVLVWLIGLCGLSLLFWFNSYIVVKQCMMVHTLDTSYKNNVIVHFDHRFFSINQDTWCILSKESSSDYVDLNDDHWVKADLDHSCTLSGNPGDYFIYFKNKNGILNNYGEAHIIVNAVPEFIIGDDSVFLIPGEKYLLTIDKNSSNSIIRWKSSDESVVSVDNGMILGVGDGKAVITGMTKEGLSDEVLVEVTSLIQAMPQSFSYSKPFLACKQYSSEEANTLDRYLENRIHRVGYQTRAGVVEAARFLTLSFPYRVSYFFENGRMNPFDGARIDAEGRYYHKGLYLSEEKYEAVGPVLDGPMMWGCDLINRDDSTDDFILFKKYPNGLDCSGFVTWALLNGGFDVGDVGAGDNPDSDNDLSDLGDYLPVNFETLSSGKVKVGDLIGIWGHAAMIVGMDDSHIYVAESNIQFRGPVINTYTWTELVQNFTFIRLMDSVYKEDGHLTDMWY